MTDDQLADLYRRLRPGLVQRASRMTTDAALAEDFVDESWYRFLRRYPSCASEGVATRLLFTILMNTIRDYFRRQRKFPEEALFEQATLEHLDGVVRVEIEDAIERLSERERYLIRMRFLEQLNLQAIAKRLRDEGRPRSSISSVSEDLIHALNKLRYLMGL